MSQIVPAFLVESFEEFETKLRLVEPHTKFIQVDVLDGSLFGQTNWFDAEQIGTLKTDVEMELHLMVKNPLPLVEAWKKYVPTFKRAIIHAEIDRPVGAMVDQIKDKLGLEVGVAVNPETPLSAIENVLHTIDQLTVMGVHPGKSGQAFLGQSVLDKIAEARQHREDLVIEMDGGLTDELIEPLTNMGASRLCAASLIFKDPDPTAKLQALNERLTSLDAN